MTDMSDLRQLQLATRGADPPDAPRYPFDPPPPPFADEACEPWIGAATIRLQREVHLGYARRLNELLARSPQLRQLSVETLVRRSGELPELERPALRDAAIGHANHQFWWKMLKPGGNGGAGPEGRLAELIERDFRSLGGMRARLEALALGHVGSGWAYLAIDPLNGALRLVALPNNGSIMDLGMPGIMIVDLWEHAYALDRGVDRAAYLAAWWEVVDWQALERRLDGFLSAATHV